MNNNVPLLLHTRFFGIDLALLCSIIGTMLCVVVSFLPQILRWDFDYGPYANDTKNLPILLATSSEIFKYAQIASLAASVPSMLHYIGEYVRAPTWSLYCMAATSSFVHFFTIVIPSILLLTYCVQYHDFRIAILVFQLQSIIFNWMSVSYVIHFIKWQELKPQLVLTVLGLNLSKAISVISCYHGGNSATILFNFSLTFFFVGLAALSWFIFRYSKCMYKRYLEGDLSTDEFCCNIYVASLLFVNLSYLMLTLATTSFVLFSYLNVVSLVGRNMIYLTCQVTNTLFLGVAVRREAFKTRVRQLL